MSKLIVVESPTKARTIGRFLGSDYRVVASSGHIRDLPKRSIGYDEQNFEPQYEVIATKKNAIKALRDAAHDADEVIIATDPDREGEAIGWHVASVLGLKNDVKRMEFHEITQKAVDAALAHPRRLDMNLVNSQQARRVLDRMVGYKLSPVVWRKVQRGTSAGRVQSVAVRVICDREREIQNFVPREYWTIDGLFTPSNAGREPAFTATLTRLDDKKAELGTEAEATAAAQMLRGLGYAVKSVESRRVKKSAPPPFTTSTLQQAAANRLNFAAKRTMKIAQELYEGIKLGQAGEVGLITYMRTDSVNIADDAISAARQYIGGEYGKEYVPASPNRYRTKAKSAQEAHEAIRPTDVTRTPDVVARYLSKEQATLYRLIWQRFVACQMAPAEYDRTTVDVGGQENAKERAVFRATASPLAFPGYLAAYGVTVGTDDEGAATERSGDEGAENAALPPLAKGQGLRLLDLKPEQHFTKPPARFNEASLVKFLEEQGIGRPSTYATIISTIQDRGYVERQDRALVPTPLGFATSDLLVEHFPDIVDTGFTANMESELDGVADAEKDWRTMLRSFATPFEERVEQKLREVGRVKIEKAPPEPTGEICPDCGEPLVQRTGRFGPFVACSNYPTCKYVKREPKEPPKVTDIPCPQCGKPLVERVARKGRGAGKPFLGCSGYPKCRYTQQIQQPEGAEASRPVPEVVPA
jgi:DNA topoisomerase-1